MTTHRLTLSAIVIAIAGLVTVGFGNLSGQFATDAESNVDQVFRDWTDATPGCAVGVNVAGATVLAKAYGMADLEREVKNTPETIFEAGSVAKQFTAAAVLLLPGADLRGVDLMLCKRTPKTVLTTRSQIR